MQAWMAFLQPMLTSFCRTALLRCATRHSVDVSSGFLHSLLHRWYINNHKFWLRTYFLLLKIEQHLAPYNRRTEFLSHSLLHKPNTDKTSWIYLKRFVWTGVTILSTCAKFCLVSVIRMREKNRRHYFWSTSLRLSSPWYRLCNY